MKKRCFTFLLLTVCFLLLPLTAYADVLVEPNNDFYTRHRSECTSLSRSFYANGENGVVSVKKEPGSKTETAVIENGETLWIMFTYNHKGELWGVTEIYTEGQSYNERPNGWISMSDLLLVYDYISFAEDHQTEFYTYTGNYDMLYETGDIVFWTWPGSGKTAWILEDQWRNPETDANFLQASHAYMDSDGREWGFFGYVYGTKNTWVCLNDPGNTSIEAFNPPPEPELWRSDGNHLPPRALSVPILIIILVAVLVVGTAVLIRILWKPNKGKT